MLIVCLYVDDLIYVSNDGVMLAEFKKSMMNEFDMIDLGLMHYFLIIEVVQSPTGIFISQKKHVYCDNVSAIKLSRNPVLHGRSKHIDVRFHFLRDLCKNGVIELVFCKSEDQTADLLTNPLKPPVFMKLRRMLGVCFSKDIV